MLNYCKRLYKRVAKQFQEQRGQSTVILAAVFVGLVGMLGLAIDIGLVYIERIRINRAVDAAVLAAVVELPSEEDAMIRAIEYLRLNNYEAGDDVRVLVRGCATSVAGGNVNENGNNVGAVAMDPIPTGQVRGYEYVSATTLRDDGSARATFMVDVGAYRADGPAANECGVDAYGTSNRIKVAGRSLVDMSFMRLLGFPYVAVYAEGVAETTANLDIVLVFDVSASMEFTTACEDCWVKETNNPNYPDNGYFNPLPFNTAWYNPGIAPADRDDSVVGSALCNAIDPNAPVGVVADYPYVVPSEVLTISGETTQYRYSVHEAEYYSAVYPEEGWELNSRQAGLGFWAIQRGSRNDGPNTIDNALLDGARVESAGRFVGYDGVYDFFQGNQAGNPNNQSANVCNPGIKSAGDRDIDCTLGFGGSTICEATVNGEEPVDCSAYVKAMPFLAYSPEANDSILGGTYDDRCFSGDCWGDADFPVRTADIPYLEYDFRLDTGWWDDGSNEDIHIWVRAISGGQGATEWVGETNPNTLGNRTTEAWRDKIYWEVDLLEEARSLNPNEMEEDSNDVEFRAGHTDSTADYDADSYWRDTRALATDWRWVKLGSYDMSGNLDRVHTLRIYQGSAGFKIDRILFTDNMEEIPNSYDNSATTDQELRQNNFYTALCGGIPTDVGHDNTCTADGPRAAIGPQISQGSATREACNVCNPIYGQQLDPANPGCGCEAYDLTQTELNASNSPTAGTLCTGDNEIPGSGNQLESDLFSGIEPLRSAQEAAKAFTTGLDPQFDQLGFVAFSNDVLNDSSVRAKLQCINSDGIAGCYQGGSPVTYTRVLEAVEAQWPLNGTDIAEGIREGLEVLGVPREAADWNAQSPISRNCTAVENTNDGDSCSRGEAAQRIIILLTDGLPTDAPGSPGTGRIWGTEPDTDNCSSNARPPSEVFGMGRRLTRITNVLCTTPIKPTTTA